MCKLYLNCSLMINLLLWSLCADSLSIMRDPFARNDQMPCDEQAQALLTTIQAWQLKGMVQLPNQNQIWLWSQNQWLMVGVDLITDNQFPQALLPWRVVKVMKNQVIWQAKLPDYCQQSLSWTMPLQAESVSQLDQHNQRSIVE